VAPPPTSSSSAWSAPPGADASFDPAAPGATLRGGTGQGPALVRLADPATGTLASGVTPRRIRQLTLNEVEGPPQAAIDPMTLAPYPPGVFIPGFGPPGPYDGNPLNTRAVGGNPDIAALGPNGRPAYLVGAPQPPLPHEAGGRTRSSTSPAR